MWYRLMVKLKNKTRMDKPKMELGYGVTDYVDYTWNYLNDRTKLLT